MNTFASALQRPQKTTTTNGMAALDKTGSKVLDFFYQAAARRGNSILGLFTAAYQEDKELALRAAMWLRDVRGGAGERAAYREILTFLEQTSPEDAVILANKTPEVGRWDDLLVFNTDRMKSYVVNMVKAALAAGNGLCAKWMPRKGATAADLRARLGLTPKTYRKTLVNLSTTVETQMCARDWAGINFSHVPSQAFSIYKNAFHRRQPARFEKFLADVLAKKEGVKVNASAIFPHDILSSLNSRNIAAVTAQWDALPNYTGKKPILPVVDVSGSMSCPAGSGSSVTCMQVAIALGLYLADKQKNAFEGIVATFSNRPVLYKLKGSIVEKMTQISRSQWDMNTNIQALAVAIVNFGRDNKIADKDMPETVLILSDMQFDAAVQGKETAQEMFQRTFLEGGYSVPQIIYWNLNGRYGNAPVAESKFNTALISGFSPSVLTAVMEGDSKELNPYQIMLKKLMSPRYNLN